MKRRSGSAPLAVIVSTYNNPQALRMGLWGLKAQQDADFEILIADDGSGASTADILREPAFAGLAIRHCWHPDSGFRLSMARNRAIASTAAAFTSAGAGKSGKPWERLSAS